jgi:hypothetical protein
MDQAHELKAVICWTMKTVEEQFIFENSYPGLIECNSWNRSVIWQACDAMCTFAPVRVKDNYRTIVEHVDADRDYLKEISSLVSHLSA